MNKEKNKINKKESISDDFPLIFPKTRNKLGQKIEKYMRLVWDLHNKTKGITFSHNEKRAYYEELYSIFNEVSWRTLPFWGKTIFFGRWFYVISDYYMREYKIYELMEREIPDEKIFKLFNMRDKNTYGNNKKEKLIDSFNCIGFIPLPKEERDFFLKGTNILENEEIVSTPSIQDVKEIEHALNRIKNGEYSRPDIEPLKLLYINVRYPIKQILTEVENIIKHEQKNYYSKFPEIEPSFIKKTKDGRNDSYPFDEWERYLKIYMLKKLGKTNRELAEQFYHTKNENTVRQVLRDNQKAKTLSKNAVEENFPGKY